MMTRKHAGPMATTLTAVALLATGCGKGTITVPDGDTGASGAPALPSVSTMKVNLDFFGVVEPVLDPQTIETGKPSQSLELYATNGNRSNFINGYVRAIFATLTTYDLLEEPIGAFALAIHSVPQPQKDGSYLWTYIFVDGSIEYSIFLYGTPLTGDRAEWRMEVSSNNAAQPLNHFVWFDGESGENDGYWQFYEPVSETDGVAVARVDWLEGRVEGRTTISVNGAGHEDEGDYLEFHETEFTGSIEYHDASAGETARVEWHADGTGFVQAPDYNDGTKSCWDEHQRDTVCP